MVVHAQGSFLKLKHAKLKNVRLIANGMIGLSENAPKPVETEQEQILEQRLLLKRTVGTVPVNLQKLKNATFSNVQVDCLLD